MQYRYVLVHAAILERVALCETSFTVTVESLLSETAGFQDIGPTEPVRDLGDGVLIYR